MTDDSILADPTHPLRRALNANAAFSAASGLLLALGAVPVARFLGIAPYAWGVAAVGLGLLGFAAEVARQARRKPVDARRVGAICAADLAWVVASRALLAGWPELLSLAGRIAVAAVAIAVGAFAGAQAIGLAVAHPGVRGDAPSPRGGARGLG